MKRSKGIFIHILPVLLGVAFTVFLSALLATSMVVREREDSFEQLESVGSALRDKMDIQFTNGLNNLARIADAIGLRVDMHYQSEVLSYISHTQPSTMFERIDILMGDGVLLHQTGASHRLQTETVNLAGLTDLEPHYTGRQVAHMTGWEVIYGVAPLRIDGEVQALLIGVIRCDLLPDNFRSYSFGGNSTAMLIDRRDGKILMDNWHDELATLQDYTTQKRLRGYEEVDVVGDLLSGKSGIVAFYSNIDGAAYYMSYQPLSDLPWMLAVSAVETDVFENVREMIGRLWRIAVIEMMLLVSYVLWNVFVARALIRQDESVQRMELEAETNKAKTLFLSSVSHDIRTPLNGIIGMLEVIDRRRAVPQEIRDDLKKIRVSAEYLSALADNVLDLTALESGKNQAESLPLDLRSLKDTLDIIIPNQAAKRGIFYRMEIRPLLHPRVLGCAGYLQRVLANLISNAIKYNRENGEVRVTVEETEPQQGRSLYRFTVQDTGLGMSAEFQKKMFSAFEQERAGSRSGNQGHGLGLTIVDRMVRSMGGSIHVESEEGVGSTFTVDIPFAWDLESGDHPLPQEEEALSLEGLHILLVEDNDLNLEIARVLLEDAGAHLTAAVNGREAVDAFTATPSGYFDLILMDVMMPVMDGLEATAAIRATPRPDAQTVPIIAMTANTFAEDVARCRAAGMDAHLGKPLDMAAMLATISRTLSAKKK